MMRQKDLEFFKNFLEQRKQVILENLKSNSREIKALRDSVPSDNIDFSSIESDSQINLTISANLEQELKEIEESLDKIKNGSFGICESCNELIDIKRLKVKPYAKYCISCRKSAEKGELL